MRIKLDSLYSTSMEESGLIYRQCLYMTWHGFKTCSYFPTCWQTQTSKKGNILMWYFPIFPSIKIELKEEIKMEKSKTGCLDTKIGSSLAKRKLLLWQPGEETSKNIIQVPSHWWKKNNSKKDIFWNICLVANI